jgi:hypothetical protein
MPPSSAIGGELAPFVLLIADKAQPNVRATLVQLRSRARSTFSNLVVVSTFDAVGCRRPDRQAGELPPPDLPSPFPVQRRLGLGVWSVSPQTALVFRRRRAVGGRAAPRVSAARARGDCALGVL